MAVGFYMFEKMLVEKGAVMKGMEGLLCDAPRSDRVTHRDTKE
jgi:hypothetical protein